MRRYQYTIQWPGGRESTSHIMADTLVEAAMMVTKKYPLTTLIQVKITSS